MMNWAKIRNMIGLRFSAWTISWIKRMAVQIGEDRRQRCPSRRTGSRPWPTSDRSDRPPRAAGPRSARGSRLASRIAPARPTAAASDGVASPNMMAPSTARISTASGKKDVSRSRMTSPNGCVDLLLGQLRGKRRVDDGAADHVDDVQPGQEKARQQRRRVQADHRLPGRGAVEDQHHRGRDQDAQRAAGADHARRTGAGRSSRAAWRDTPARP